MKTVKYSVNMYLSYFAVDTNDNDHNHWIIDISNPSSPTLQGNYKTDGGSGVSVSGKYAYIGNNNGLDIVDISNPSSPVLKGNYYSPGVGIGFISVPVSNNRVYVSDAYKGLLIIDVTNP